jgi:NHL repeat
LECREVTPSQVGFPGARLAARLETRVKRGGKWCREIVYLVSSLTLEELQALEMLSLKRGYWVIESRLHHCLDITLREDQRGGKPMKNACSILLASAVMAWGQPQYAFTNFDGMPGGPGNVDGIGSAARFNSPFGVAVDSVGNVYVADTQNSTIRKITPAGVVTTLAGRAGWDGPADGTGGAARFYRPNGVAVDSAGNVYVADGLSIVRDSIAVIDRVLKCDLPQGPCWRRYNHDGYGQKDDGSAFDWTGVGRAWPILTGERGHYELAAGGNPLPFIAAGRSPSDRMGNSHSGCSDGCMGAA